MLKISCFGLRRFLTGIQMARTVSENKAAGQKSKNSRKDKKKRREAGQKAADAVPRPPVPAGPPPVFHCKACAHSGCDCSYRPTYVRIPVIYPGNR